ncbi:MAG: glycoside hydrolase family 3 C-terminal domain-containing protein [Ruminococcus sp.]|jgi:beta-glucosidase|nr:glycoside hydrolase family 3 C-terminal domain-containing protein [Ruminococcus sp.]
MERTKAIEKAKALVAQMTVEEACSQLRYDAPEIVRLGVPAYNWWSEALHGVARAGIATVFPQAVGMAAMFDPEMMDEIADTVATEGRAKYNEFSKRGDRDIYKGLTFWTPNINIFRDPRWGRGHETYGEDPYLTAELGKAFVHGLQGDGPVMKAAACAKHYAVHSGPEGIRHEFDAKATVKDMEETYLPAFEALVTEADVESVMGAYNRTNGEPCCGHKVLMVDILRGKWKFKGHFVSDCWAIQDFHTNHMVTNSVEESAALAIKNGCDLNCGNTYIHIFKAYNDGLVTEEQIRTAAERLFTTRYLLGIMGGGSEWDNLDYSVIECDKHLALAKRAAEKSCVLLKNDGILPLDISKYKTIGVIGPNAYSRAALVGNYHGYSARYISVLEGIRNYAGKDAQILYSEGCKLSGDRVEGLGNNDDRISEARTVAALSDLVIMVVGLDETLEGEQGDTGNSAASGDKGDLLLPRSQRRMMRAVMAEGKPVVVVLMAGSSIDLEEVNDSAKAILHAWYPGGQGGETVADILFGKVSPSGKLSVTFYHNGDLPKMPDFTDYNMKGRTYRYIDFAPLYPFGYGLTYGDVSVKSASVKLQPDGSTVVEAVAVNKGKRDTEDVVQVYLQNEGSANAPKNPRLAAFKRVLVPAGGEAAVSMTIKAKQFTVVDDAGNHVDEGTPVLYVGMGQPDARTEELTGQKSVKVTL